MARLDINTTTSKYIIMMSKQKKSEYNKKYREEHAVKIAARRKIYRAKNKDKIKKYREEHKDDMKRWLDKNKLILSEKNKQYYERNKERIAALNKVYREEHKEIIRANKKIYRAKNITAIKERDKKWYSENKDHRRDYMQKWYNENKEAAKIKNRNRYYLGGGKPMSENKSCSSYLGCHVAERVLSKIFKGVKVMPPNNHGYDFICRTGKKIDVKSSCLVVNKGKRRSWGFAINKNTAADFFLCIAFDNRDDLTPLYLWLLPGNVVNHLTRTSISISTIDRWDAYRIEIDKVTECCDSMKG